MYTIKGNAISAEVTYYFNSTCPCQFHVIITVKANDFQLCGQKHKTCLFL